MQKISNMVKKELLAKAGVVGVGWGYKFVKGKKTKDVGIVVYVVEKKPKAQIKKRDLVPDFYGGVRTDVVESGEIKSYQDPTGRFRPAPGGVSVGHYSITAGTLGCWVEKEGLRYMLSNNHVLAASNEAQLGDMIYQPGPYDGGTAENDIIAGLSQFVPIEFGSGLPDCDISSLIEQILNWLADWLGSRYRATICRVDFTEESANLVDAAIALPLNVTDIKSEILQIGKLAGFKRAELGDQVQKFGRTTGYTTGVVQTVEASVQVQYGAGKIAIMEDQVISDIGSDGGDSGSAIVDMSNVLRGLLFAGGSGITVFNQIDNVFSLLGLNGVA